MAATQGLEPPRGPKTLKDHFWRQIFAPTYRLLPWSIRKRIIQAMPGSHRQDWPQPNYESRKPAI